MCYGPRVDKTGKETLSKIDNMSEACLDLGVNLELQLIRLVPPEAGSTVSASCPLSTKPTLHCPDL